MSDTEVRKAYKVHGRVQGVGFRWWAQRQARSLGLRGSVRNCVDGTVDVVLAGSASAVLQMKEWLEEGPPAARVVRLEELTPPQRVPDGFEIAF